MKTLKSYINLVILAVAIFIATGTTAYGFEVKTEPAKKTHISTFQAENNSQSILCNEASVAEVIPTTWQSQIFFFNFLRTNFRSTNVSETVAFTVYYNTFQFRDRRGIIGKHIFPSHFYW